MPETALTPMSFERLVDSIGFYFWVIGGVILLIPAGSRRLLERAAMNQGGKQRAAARRARNHLPCSQLAVLTRLPFGRDSEIDVLNRQRVRRGGVRADQQAAKLRNAKALA